MNWCFSAPSSSRVRLAVEVLLMVVINRKIQKINAELFLQVYGNFFPYQLIKSTLLVVFVKPYHSVNFGMMYRFFFQAKWVDPFWLRHFNLEKVSAGTR